MASSSTLPIQKSFKYDVFLSFRGEDTRKNFVDHLYYALQQKSIHTYKDDERTEKGTRISNELIKSIKDSNFYIIVFSKNYASSSWCLDELVKIMKCQKKTGQTAYPIFYDVEPTEVRKQSGKFGEAFAQHRKEECFAKWRDALEEAADLVGWELKNTDDGHEAKLVTKVVEKISLELYSTKADYDGKLIGMEIRVKQFFSLLQNGFDDDDVRMIGIKGMGGSGKTTLARVVFNQLSFQFEGISFVENVREVSNTSLSGLSLLQKKVISDVFYGQGITISNVDDGKNKMKRMISGKKALVVLDDVYNIDQLEALAGEPDWFKSGSTIIITTRDEQVLIAHRVSSILDVSLLSQEEATSLFSRYAFGSKIPIQRYTELSRQVVRYAAGLPLTIRVLGLYLCGKNELEWIDALKRLKTIPLKETLENLELSYISLEEDCKEIFLDVACILKGWMKEKAVRVLESCGFHAQNGLRVLEQKSLITISPFGTLDMHDHIEELGKNIVRRLHPDEPIKHSRLWIDMETKDILAKDLGTEATRCIKLSTTMEDNLEVVIRGLANMKKLKVLFMRSEFALNIDEASQCFPNTLRYLFWNCYCFKTLPETFQPDYLVGLEMTYSSIVQLWEGGERKVLSKLRFLDLSYSKLRSIDLGMTPNLEILKLKGCCNLEEFHMPFGCVKLKSLNLNDSQLRTLDLGPTPDLEKLSLEGCCKLVELHMPFGCLYLRSLNLSYSRLRTLDLRQFSNLETLILEHCDNLVELHMPVGCSKIKYMILDYSKLRALNLGLTPDLETLSLVGCDFVELQMPFRYPMLQYMYLEFSKLRSLDLGLPRDYETLIPEECDLVEIPFGCPKLKFFSLNNTKLEILNLGPTLDLEILRFEICDLLELHIPFGCLNLKSLHLAHSKLRILELGWTPHIERLNLEECFDLVEIHAPVGCLKNLVYLNLSGCGRFKSFVYDKQFQSLEVGSLSELHLIGESVDICPLHHDNSLPKFRFTCFYKEQPGSSYGNFEKLISVGLCACTNLAGFSKSICGLRCLRKLKLEGCIPEVPKDLHQLEGMEELTFSSSDIKYLPDSICMLKHLKFLNLNLVGISGS